MLSLVSLQSGKSYEELKREMKEKNANMDVIRQVCDPVLKRCFISDLTFHNQ